MRLNVMKPTTLGADDPSERALIWNSTKSSTSAGFAFSSRRPNPARSEKLGWAPISTCARRARRTVARITRGSPA